MPIDALALFMVFLCENVSIHGGRMEGKATGEHKAVRLAQLSLDVATDLNRLLAAIVQFGNGNGQVTLHVVNGEVGDMDMSSRLHRRRMPRRIRLETAAS